MRPAWSAPATRTSRARSASTLRGLSSGSAAGQQAVALRDDGLTIAHVPEKVVLLPLRSPVYPAIHAAMRSQRRNDPGIISLVQKLTDAAAETTTSHSPEPGT